MRKTLIAVATIFILLQTGSALADDLPMHGPVVEEIISIDAQMAEVEKKLRTSPNDQSLIAQLKDLEAELMSKLDAFESLKQKAINTMPAAGSTQK